METVKRKRGNQLRNAERQVLIAKLVDELSNGYINSNALAKRLNVSRDTIENYRPLVDKLIADQHLDKNIIRNLQLKRTYNLIESLMDDLKECTTIKEKTLIYNQIYKFSSHLALITGLNIETHVNIDPTKLVIIRSNQRKTKDRIIDSDTSLLEQSDK
jgi:hypothetical protein